MISIVSNLFLKFRESEFARNVAKLSSGTSVAQLISILTAPILYRIYDREDYGTLGLYMAVTGVVSVFSTMQYLQPILLEKNDEDAKRVMWLNRTINTIVSLFVFLLVFLFGDYIGSLLGNPAIMPWLYLAPISIFFTGQNEIFSLWANRKKKYKVLTINAVLSAVLVPLVSISIGLQNNGPLGLFLGLLIGSIIPTLVLLITLTKNEDLGFKYFNWNNIKIDAKKHENFPLYSLPSVFINRFTNQLPVFMLSTYAGPSVVGVYNLCTRMLGLPSTLVSNAIATVYRQKVTNNFGKTGDVRDIMLKTFKYLVIIVIIPLIIILFFGPNLFTLFFGKEWYQSGEMAQILIFSFSFQMIVSPLTYIFYVRDRLKENMIAHLYILASNFLIFNISFNLSWTVISVLTLYVTNTCLTYTYYFFRSYSLSRMR